MPKTVYFHYLGDISKTSFFYGVLMIFIGYSEEIDSSGHSGSDHDDAKWHAVHEHAHNFEISATLITVILLGKWMESFSKKQTVDKLSELASLKVTKAQLVYKRGSEEEEKGDYELNLAGKDTDVDLLVVGDVIKVINGDTIPIDGTVVKGEGITNESMLTGESRPIQK